MRGILVAGVALLCACARPSPYRSLDDVVPPILREDRIPSAVVVVGDGDGVSYRRAFGGATNRTLFDLASVTKVVATTTSVLLLVEEGRLSLDDDPGRWIPALRGLTLRALLTHESGLPAYLSPRGRSAPDLLEAIARLKADGKTRYS